MDFCYFWYANIPSGNPEFYGRVDVKQLVFTALAKFNLPANLLNNVTNRKMNFHQN
jgi:hypothetical protein